MLNGIKAAFKANKGGFIKKALIGVGVLVGVGLSARALMKNNEELDEDIIEAEAVIEDTVEHVLEENN